VQQEKAEDRLGGLAQTGPGEGAAPACPPMTRLTSETRPAEHWHETACHRSFVGNLRYRGPLVRRPPEAIA